MSSKIQCKKQDAGTKDLGMPTMAYLAVKLLFVSAQLSSCSKERVRCFRCVGKDTEAYRGWIERRHAQVSPSVVSQW